MARIVRDDGRRGLLVLAIGLAVSACAGCAGPDRRVLPQPVRHVLGATPGERTAGATQVRDQPDGEVLFTLRGGTRVELCPWVEGDWYRIELKIDVSDEEFTTGRLDAATSIVVSGSEVGEAVQDVQIIPTTGSDEGGWAILQGVVRMHDIQPHSIIEAALVSFTATAGEDRSISAFAPFIADFQLAEGALPPFKTFERYESCDPSPGIRIQLAFYEDRLIGIVFSRDVRIAETDRFELERGYRLAAYADVERSLVEQFVTRFNAFVYSGD